jgi:hypothetical protein
MNLFDEAGIVKVTFYITIYWIYYIKYSMKGNNAIFSKMLFAFLFRCCGTKVIDFTLSGYFENQASCTSEYCWNKILNIQVKDL